MSRARVALVIVALILVGARRLPAPISEESSPTPVAEKPAKPKIKHTKPKGEKSSPSIAQPTPQKSALFAGTWVGVVDWGIFGTTEHTIVIDPAQTTINITGCGSGTIFPASVSTNGISWATGYFREHKWMLRAYPDGRSALVLVNGQSVTFRRAQ